MPLAWALYAAAALLVLAGFKPLQRWHLRHIPGPAPRFFLGNIIEIFKQGSHNFFLACAQKWPGGIFKVWGPLGPTVVLTRPELARAVLLHNHNRATIPTLLLNSSTNKDFESALILTARDERWRSIRHAWTPLFFTGSLEGYSMLMNSCTDTLLARLDAAAAAGQIIDIWSMLGDLTMHVIGSSAFGVDFSTQAEQTSLSKEQQEEVQQLRSAATVIFAEGLMNSKWMVLLLLLPPSMLPAVQALARTFPDKVMRRTVAARNTLITISTKLVSEHRQAVTGGGSTGAAKSGSTPSDARAHAHAHLPSRGTGSMAKGKADPGHRKGVAPGSFIDLLVTAADRTTGRAFTDGEIAAQAFTSILAGYETTANAITFAIYCLATNPDKQTKMLEDIDAFGKRKPQYADLEEGFPYVHAVVQETLRLYPPAPFTTREAVQDQVLAGHRIAKGTALTVSLWAMHRDPTMWHQADAFVPERWLAGTHEAAKCSSEALTRPFGDGLRQCPAYRFAMEEAKIVLIRMYQEYHLTLQHQGEPLAIREGITLCPKGGLQVVAHSRLQFAACKQ